MADTDTRVRKLLSGAMLRLQLPNIMVGLATGGATVFYVAKTTEAPPGVLSSLVGLMVAMAIVSIPLVQIPFRRMVGIVSRLASGKEPPTVENLQAAVRQTYGFADRLMPVLAGTWMVVLGVILVMMARSGAGLEGSVAFQVTWRALLICPACLAITHLATTHVAREVIQRLQLAGLTPDQLLAAVPVRRQIRLRVVLFMLVLTATPAALCVDLVTALTEQAAAEVRRVGAEWSAAEAALDRSRTTVLVLGGYILLLGVFGAFLWGASIGQPLRALAAEADRIARGDLSGSRVTPAEDEVWAVSAAMSRLHAELVRLLSDMHRAGLSVSTAAEQMLAHAESSRSGAASQALSAHQTSSATEEMARVAEQIAEKAGAVAATAADTLQAARSGQDSSKVFNEAIAILARDNKAVAEAVARLKKVMNQIGRIVDTINGIADRSDLLALNAELEGTKAGETGRGFSLVAGEMRRLAVNVMRSTREIAQLIEEVREATGEAVAATETGIHATAAGARVARELGESLEKIVELAQVTAESATTINFATQQQRSSSAQLAETMQAILEVSQTTVAATRNVSTSSNDLAQLARRLAGAVERFKVQA